MNLIQNKNKGYLRAFLISFAVITILLLPFIIINKGILFLTNDFNTQQLPFYVLCHEAVKSGSLFSSLTDLGSSLLGSYSFYTLGSPFFWLTLPFDSSVLPYLMGPLLIFKFSIAGLTSYAYLRRYVSSDFPAIIGSLLYAFSGFQMFNMFYNHFADVVAFFPLLLLSLDEFMENDKKGFLAFSVFLNAVTNYIFFVGECVFLLIYFIVKLCSKNYRLTVKRFFFAAFEVLLGFFAAAFIIFPAVLFVVQNPRTSEHLIGMDMFVYTDAKKYIEILRALLLPAETPHIEPFVPKTAGTRWVSPAAFVPMFSLSAVFAFFYKREKSFLKRTFIVCGLFMFIPILNSSFYMFNSYYYARWFYMPILMSVLACVIVLDKKEEYMPSFNKGINLTIIITVVFGLLFLLLPSKDELGVVKIGIWNKLDLLYCIFYIAVAIGGLFLLKIIFKRMKDLKKQRIALFAGTIVVIVVCGFVNIATMKGCGPESEYYMERFVSGNEALQNEDSDSYRIDTSSIYYNVHMWWKKPSMATFNSTINGNEINFYSLMGINRFVATMPSQSYYSLRSLFSVKYAYIDEDDECTMPGFVNIGTQNEFAVYKNTNYIPMGFCYDRYITLEQFEELSQNNRDNVLLKAMLLDDVQIGKYSSMLSPILSRDLLYPTADYEKDCENRAAKSCYEFNWDKNGFNAKIKLEKENLVFFSVPYDKGFKAYVNGEEVRIENVNGGFMAVKAERGDNHIAFEYYPEGLKSGTIVSLICLSLMLIYSSVLIIKKHIENSFKKKDN